MLRRENMIQGVRKGEITIRDKDINEAVLEALLRGQKECQNSYKAYGVRPSRSGKMVSEGRRRAARVGRFNPLHDHDDDDLNLVEYTKCTQKAREEIVRKMLSSSPCFSTFSISFTFILASFQFR